MSDQKEHFEAVRMGISRFGTRGIAPVVGVVAVLAILLLGTGAAAACGTSGPPPTTPTVLDTIPWVNTIAANSSMVFAQSAVNCTQIWGITPSGNVSVYATIPTPLSQCREGSLALAPIAISVGGLPPGPSKLAGSPRNGADHNGGGSYGGSDCRNRTNDTLYDVEAGVLYEITDGGSNVQVVATFHVPTNSAESMGLTYDQVGTFNHDLVVISSDAGKIWLVNASGNVTFFAELHTFIAGVAVAPSGFGAYGGDILVAAKTLGEVEAVSPSGNVSVVTSWPKADSVAFPSSGGYGGGHGWGFGGQCGATCSFGPNHYVFFVANYTSGAVEAFPTSDFRGYSGQGFVAGGQNHGIAAFTASGTTTLFASQTLRLSDIAFISCFGESHGHGGHWGGGGGW
jgi:hypothetical protein